MYAEILKRLDVLEENQKEILRLLRLIVEPSQHEYIEALAKEIASGNRAALLEHNREYARRHKNKD